VRGTTEDVRANRGTAGARTPLRRRAARQDAGTDPNEEADVTLLWFVVWLICDLIGDRESLTFDPVNAWAATLVLAIALDLGRQHAPDVGRRGSRD
jgi:hypothetical protein